VIGAIFDGVSLLGLVLMRCRLQGVVGPFELKKDHHDLWRHSGRVSGGERVHQFQPSVVGSNQYSFHAKPERHCRFVRGPPFVRKTP
jgi:hypothetical protein